MELTINLSDEEWSCVISALGFAQELLKDDHEDQPLLKNAEEQIRAARFVARSPRARNE